MAKFEPEIIQSLATKYSLPKDKIEKIVRSQFKFLHDTIAEGSLETVRLTYFGKWYVTDARKKSINKKNGTIHSSK